MTRFKQIEQAGLDLGQDLFLPTFIKGAEWADQNQDRSAVNYLETELIDQRRAMDQIDLELHKTKEKLSVALKALNRLALLQSGELDYTQEFFEITKMTIRDALDKISKI
jgi:hypothetical protein